MDMDTERVRVELPDMDDSTAVDGFIVKLQSMEGVRGIKTLLGHLAAYKKHQKYLDDDYDRIQTTLRSVNGERKRTAIDKGSLEYVSKAFFAALSTPALRKQCDLYEVNFDAYDDIDGIVDALVERQVELSN